MPIDAPPPQNTQEDPWQPGKPPDPLVFDKFNGINTNTLRPGVEDERMAWCDGFIPLAPYNLRTLPGIGSPIWVGPQGVSGGPNPPGTGGGGSGGGSGTEFVTIFLTATGTFTVPADWDSANNTVETIGAGGHGGPSNRQNIAGQPTCFAGGGGQGGGYAKMANLTLTAGAAVPYTVGKAGAADVTGGDTFFGAATLAASWWARRAGCSGVPVFQPTPAGRPATTATTGFIGTTVFPGGMGAAGGGGRANGGGGGGGGAAGGDGAGGDWTDRTGRGGRHWRDR